MGICNPLICFLICTQFIINSSKETCTAGTFQERLIKKRRISKTKAKSKIKNEITEKSERRSIKCLNKQSHCYFLCLRSLVSSSKRYHLGLQLRSVQLTGVVDVSTTFSQYVNSNVILCVGMFVVGQALFETGMANKIGGLVTRFARTERTLIIAIMVIVGVMSGFLSNTGTAAVLIPVVCGIADESGYSRSRLLMPLVFAAALGGNLSIIGAPGNLMGVNALQEMGLSTSFFMYAPVGVPMLLVGIIYFVFIGYRFLPDGKGAVGATVEKQKDFSDVPKWKQTVSLIVLILVILAMIFEKQIGVSIEISACIGAIILVLVGVLSEKEALASIDLKVVFLFGGSLTLAKALDTTGAGELIADKIVGLLGADPNPIVLLLVIFIVTCALTNFMSNTATTALMIPIAVSLANNLGADPRAVVIATVIAGSCAYATPIGMPANTMVVGLGGYKFKDYVKSGLPLILVSFVICMILLPVLFPFYP